MPGTEVQPLQHQSRSVVTPTRKPQHVSLLQHRVMIHHFDLAAIGALNLKQVQAINATQTNLKSPCTHTEASLDHNASM
jgi:hypothetical protein